MTLTHRTVAGSAVTWLFVPGERPERFDKAVASGADAVVVDLEDAVAPALKAQARDHAASWLRAGGRAWVRVNGSTTPWYAADLDAVVGAGGLVGVVVPKAEAPTELAALKTRLGSTGLVALVESAVGVSRAAEIAAAVDRLAFGSIDYAADIGAEHSWDALLHARSTLVLASRLAGVDGPVDGVTTTLDDEAELARDVAGARSLGFAGKLCIHPAQVGPVARGFAPSPEEVAWARRLLAAVATDERGAVNFDGAMVDKPVVDRARRVLERSGGRHDT